jgi:hypothetical protein
MNSRVQIEVWARDAGSDWILALEGTSPRLARTYLVREAGRMTEAGWTVVGLNHGEITVAAPDDDQRRTTFRMVKERP